MRDKIKNKINFKNYQIEKNQKNEDQVQNKYKLDDTTEFLNVSHEYQDTRERKEDKEEKNSLSSNHHRTGYTHHPRNYTAT